mgnify:CR=1 FL=1
MSHLLLWAFGIVCSTLATRQHVLLDVLGGTLLAGLGLYLLAADGEPVGICDRLFDEGVDAVHDVLVVAAAPVALDQALEFGLHKIRCPDWIEPIRNGLEFKVCPAAKIPPNSAPQIWHDLYGFALAVVTFGIVFGAFAANVLYGAMNAVPRAQLETAEAYGMSHRQVFRRVLVPQMWVYALPGLSNLWLILIKATPLLFLLGIQDIVYWARELGSAKTSGNNPYPHGDWRVFYFLALLVFYLAFTRVSEVFLSRLTRRLSHGQATLGGEQLRKAGA